MYRFSDSFVYEKKKVTSILFRFPGRIKGNCRKTQLLVIFQDFMVVFVQMNFFYCLEQHSNKLVLQGFYIKESLLFWR